jgi:hypothetical protein
VLVKEILRRYNGEYSIYVSNQRINNICIVALPFFSFMQILENLVSQYVAAVDDPAVIVVTPGNCPLLAQHVDTRHISFVHVEHVLQLLAFLHYATYENVKKRHVLIVFYQMAPVLLSQKVHICFYIVKYS